MALVHIAMEPKRENLHQDRLGRKYMNLQFIFVFVLSIHIYRQTPSAVPPNLNTMIKWLRNATKRGKKWGSEL